MRRHIGEPAESQKKIEPAGPVFAGRFRGTLCWSVLVRIGLQIGGRPSNYMVGIRIYPRGNARENREASGMFPGPNGLPSQSSSYASKSFRNTDYDAREFSPSPRNGVIKNLCRITIPDDNNANESSRIGSGRSRAWLVFCPLGRGREGREATSWPLALRAGGAWVAARSPGGNLSALSRTPEPSGTELYRRRPQLKQSAKPVWAWLPWQRERKL